MFPFPMFIPGLLPQSSESNPIVAGGVPENGTMHKEEKRVQQKTKAKRTRRIKKISDSSDTTCSDLDGDTASTISIGTSISSEENNAATTKDQDKDSEQKMTLRTEDAQPELRALVKDYNKYKLKGFEEYAIDSMCNQNHHPVISCFRGITAQDIYTISSNPELKKEDQLEQSIVYLGLIDFLASTAESPIYCDDKHKGMPKPTEKVRRLMRELRTILEIWGVSDDPVHQQRYKLIMKYLGQITPFLKVMKYDQAFSMSLDSISSFVNSKKLRLDEMKKMKWKFTTSPNLQPVVSPKQISISAKRDEAIKNKPSDVVSPANSSVIATKKQISPATASQNSNNEGGGISLPIVQIQGTRLYKTIFKPEQPQVANTVTAAKGNSQEKTPYELLLTYERNLEMKNKVALEKTQAEQSLVAKKDNKVSNSGSGSLISKNQNLKDNDAPKSLKQNATTAKRKMKQSTSTPTRQSPRKKPRLDELNGTTNNENSLEKNEKIVRKDAFAILMNNSRNIVKKMNDKLQSAKK